jgi:hypothetical protein
MLSVTARAGVTATPVSDGEIDHTFQYASAPAKTVSVAGEFSNWSELPMTRDDSGTWSRTLHLKVMLWGLRSLGPVGAFFDWCIEREAIRIRREAGERPPWTQEPVFWKGCFLNVFREDDQTTFPVLLLL